MYAYQNNILSIPSDLLYKEWKLITKSTFYEYVKRGKFEKSNNGGGRGNKIWIPLDSLDFEVKGINLKTFCIEKLGNPNKVMRVNILTPFLMPDTKAIQFFADHKRPNGKPLNSDEQRIRANGCAVLNAIQMLIKNPLQFKKKFGKKKTKIWDNVSENVNILRTSEKWKHDLPTNVRSLQRKYNRYFGECGQEKQGYWEFINGNEGNINRQKLNQKAKDWVLRMYCHSSKYTIPELHAKYKIKCITEGWSMVSEATIYNYLCTPEVERLWQLKRHGLEVWRKKYQHTLSRDKEAWFPNCYWAIDGTKLDLMHLCDTSSNGLGAKIKVNVLFDVYSEKILGWAFSHTESFVEHFKAIKMGVKKAGSRPYFMSYDNQGGHKTKRMQELYSRLVATDGGTHYAHKANAHNSPIEQFFNRLQQQHINKFWYSDGQSVTVRKDDHKMNIDFIKKHKGQIKTVEELKEVWETIVNMWNNSKHPHYKETRNEVYNHSQPKQEPLELWDILPLMWIEEKQRPIEYKAEGITVRIGKEIYKYEVYDPNKKIDLEFRRKSIGKKFIVRYDPECLEDYVTLMEMDEMTGELTIAAIAEPKRKHQPVPALMKEGDKELWAEDYKVRDIELQKDIEELERLYERTNYSEQDEIDEMDLLVKLKGDLSKLERSKIEEKESLSIADLL